jgi:hypothetical protein
MHAYQVSQEVVDTTHTECESIFVIIYAKKNECILKYIVYIKYFEKIYSLVKALMYYGRVP